MRSPAFYFFSGVAATIGAISLVIVCLILIAGGFGGDKYEVTSSLRSPDTSHIAFIYYWSAGGAAGRCDVFVVIDEKDIKEVLEKGNSSKDQQVFEGSCDTNPVIEWLSDAKLLIKYHSPKDDELGGIRFWKRPTSKDGKVTISVSEIK